MTDRFEVVDVPGELAGIFIVDHGRSDMAVAVNIVDVAHANTIRDALMAGCP
jgi:hypothetical protein